MSEIKIENLAVACLRSATLAPDFNATIRNKILFRPESCSRQIIVGSLNDFDGMNIQDELLYHKEDAYAFLLGFIDGAYSKQKFENHSKNQFSSSWKQFSQKYEISSNRYKDLIGLLKKDSTFVRNKYTNNYKTPRNEVVARDLAEQNKGDSILLISDADRYKNLHKYTREIIKASENKQRRDRSAFITVTHPDNDVLQAMHANFTERLNEEFRTPIEFTLFEDLPTLLENNDICYVGLPMGGAIDEHIISAWNNTSNDTNRLVHIRGKESLRRQSNDLWANANLKNYISPEAINDAYVERLQKNTALTNQLEDIYQLCAQLRAKGLSPQYEINNNWHCHAEHSNAFALD